MSLMLMQVNCKNMRCSVGLLAQRLDLLGLNDCAAWVEIGRAAPPEIHPEADAAFMAHVIRNWLGRISVKTLLIEP